MAKFKPGTRIKKTRGKAWIGMTGIVVPDPPNLPDRYDHTIQVDQPFIGSDGKQQPAGTIAQIVGEQWDPIIPEGMKPVEWSECHWQPTKTPEKAG